MDTRYTAAACEWPFVMAIPVIGLGNLHELLDHLRAGNGMTWDELSIEVLEDDPDRALVSILDDEHTCGAPLLIAALDQLRARAEECNAC